MNSVREQFSKHNPFYYNVILKALCLFVVINVFFGFAQTMDFLGKISLYNVLFPGRLRLPYGEDPSRSYNLSLLNLEAMFASHEINAGVKSEEEFRVLVIGDSATWGYLLQPEETLAAQLTKLGLTLPDGRRVRAYNLGYPVMSLTKDLLILSLAMRYQPDMILWPVTLESFPIEKQLFAPLLQNNPQVVRDLIQVHRLNLNPDDPGFVKTKFWNHTLIGQRRSLADLLRLQIFGLMWAATGIDQYIPSEYVPRMEDLPANQDFHDLRPPHLLVSDLAFDALQGGIQAAGTVPILIINEPIFISQGLNSEIRYNFYFPRWAYDDYRELLTGRCQSQAWRCLDLWDAIPPEEFTNTAIHMTSRGTAEFARLVGDYLKVGIIGR